jgi:BirA family biotin operon repressor/biotin-[acetyl-CoA-carboxylase] ligase
MKIITENIEHARKFIEVDNKWQPFSESNNSDIASLVYEVFENQPLYCATTDDRSFWKYLLISEISARSQYDIANDLLARNINLPHGILCVAGSGGSFHGFKQRSWVSPPGNIYLTVSLAPNCAIDNFGVGFLTLAAVSVVEAIDNIPGLQGKAGIKWVNDILIDQAKVCGVLAYTQQEGDKVTGASLGIGLNVLTTPEIASTIFVPRASSIANYLDNINNISLSSVLRNLYQALETNYQLLINSGYKALLDKYKYSSIIVGRQVEIYEDVVGDKIQLLHKGIVRSIGDHLELYLEGVAKPVTRGRLVLNE